MNDAFPQPFNASISASVVRSNTQRRYDSAEPRDDHQPVAVPDESARAGLITGASKGDGNAVVPYVLQKPVIMLIGDSITELGSKSGGWVTLLGEAYIRKV